MEKIKKEIITIKTENGEDFTYKEWNIEDIANKINEIIEVLNEITKK